MGKYTFRLYEIQFLVDKNIIIFGEDRNEVKELQISLGDSLSLMRIDGPKKKYKGINVLDSELNSEKLNAIFDLRKNGYKNMISVITGDEAPFDELIKINGEHSPIFEYFTDYIITYREKNTIQIWGL